VVFFEKMKQIKLKLFKGRLSPDWDIWQVEIDGEKIPLNTTSMGGGKSYHMDEELQGVIIENKFNICKEFIHTDLGKLFGFISRDDIDSEIIHITKVGEKVGGEIILSQRNLIKNY
jgi:hypothetical protein